MWKCKVVLCVCGCDLAAGFVAISCKLPIVFFLNYILGEHS